MEIRSITISYTKHKGKQCRNRVMELQNRLEALEIMINNSKNEEELSVEIAEYENLKTELQRIYEAKGKGAILRSKVRWAEQGEKPTKYFFNLEKRHFNRKVITEIKREDGKTLVEEYEILKEIESFYGKLYASQDVDNNKAFNDFTCDLQTARLTDEEREELEGYITIEECANFPPGKSPGDDGFTAEFYYCFFHLVNRDLVNSFNAAYKEGSCRYLNAEVS